MTKKTNYGKIVHHYIVDSEFLGINRVHSPSGEKLWEFFMTEVNEYIKRLAEISLRNNNIEQEMYIKHDVKRGLRDINGNGVVAGLTEISAINWKRVDENGNERMTDGELFYRGKYPVLSSP